MFKAFMNESGIENNAACVIGGVVGRKEECDWAQQRWENALKSAHLKEFHSAEFWNRTDGRLHGDYRHLSISDADALARLLTGIVSERPLFPVAVALPTALFKSLSIDERRWLTTNKRFAKDWGSQGSPENPYFLVFQTILQQASKLTPVGETIHFTFDRQDNFAERARRLYSETIALKNESTAKLGQEIVFSPKDTAVLLQAADFVAYLSRWYAEDSQSMVPVALECFTRFAEPQDSSVFLVTPESVAL
jgi:hypothetical protein